MSESNQLSRPLGTNMPLPGGDIVDTPEPRQTLPGGSPGGGGSGPPGPQAAPQSMDFEGSRRTLTGQHSRNEAVFAATTKALRQLVAVRESLERLTKKQDIVNMEDVIEEAGKLVGHGIDPTALAGILADAPQEGGGEALGAWIAGHARSVEQAEQQVRVQNSLARQHMTMTAVHLALAHDNAQSMLGGMTQEQPPQEGNQLVMRG